MRARRASKAPEEPVLAAVTMPEIVELLRGDRCRWCGERMAWPGPAGIVSADETAECARCEARGYFSFVETNAGRTIERFEWCRICEHTGRVELCRSGRGYYAVARTAVDAFLAGTRHDVAQPGYLYAFANDAWGFYRNNSGTVRLTVTRM